MHGINRVVVAGNLGRDPGNLRLGACRKRNRIPFPRQPRRDGLTEPPTRTRDDSGTLHPAHWRPPARHSRTHPPRPRI